MQKGFSAFPIPILNWMLSARYIQNQEKHHSRRRFVRNHLLSFFLVSIMMQNMFLNLKTRITPKHSCYKHAPPYRLDALWQHAAINIPPLLGWIQHFNMLL